MERDTESERVSKPEAEATQLYVYNQLEAIHILNPDKKQYSGEDIFERDRHHLTGEQEKTILGILAFDEDGLSRKLGKVAETPEGRAQTIKTLREALNENNRIYGEIDDADPELKAEVAYSYPDILTDVTSIKGDLIKHRLFNELVELGDTEEITGQVIEDFQGFLDEMGPEVSLEMLSEIMYTTYGLYLEDEQVPVWVREAIEEKVAKLIEEAKE